MAEVKEFSTRKEFIDWLVNDWNKFLEPFGRKIEADKIECKPYGFDPRINWETYIWWVPDFGVLSFTNGNFIETERNN